MHRQLESPVTTITTPADADVFVLPCSTGQKRFWLLEQISPGDTALLIPIAVRLTGAHQIPVLEAALNEMVKRHEILRTSFALVEEEPRQIVAPTAALKMHLVDRSEVPANERSACIAAEMEQEAIRPVPLSTAPLMRATLVRLALDDAVLMLTAHHIISDGWSNGVIVRELGMFYHALVAREAPALAPLAVQFADYALWQEDWLQSLACEKQMAYWKDELSGALPVLDVPTDFARRAGTEHEAILESRLLPGELTQKLKEFCRETGTTLFMVFFAAYLVLLRRYSGQEKLLIGTTAANRNRPELEGLIGLFANILLLRGEVPLDLTFRDFMSRERDHLLNSFANHEAPFERVLEQWQASRPGRRVRGSGVQSHFLYQKAFMQPSTREGLTIQPLYSVSPGSTFELTFGIVERAEGIRLQMEYWTSLFKAPTVQRFLAHYQALLESAVTHPERRLSELPIFAVGEKEEISVGLERAGAPQLPAEQIFAKLDQHIEAHFLTSDTPFTPPLSSGIRGLVVLDEHGEFLPKGIPGQLYLAVRDEAASAGGDMVKNQDGHAFLKTGFLGRHAEMGGVELWGRCEDVVPLPVFRYNRRAVELRLGRHPAVAEASAQVNAADSGEARHVAYVALRPGANVTSSELGTFLRQSLSETLVPSSFVFVDRLPRDAAGRVKAADLPPPVERTSAPAGDRPLLQGVLEEQLLTIWRSLLKTSQISAHDNFFDLGGNSFLALRMMVEAGKLTHRMLPLPWLLTGATVAQLARKILESSVTGADVPALIPVKTSGSKPPLYFLHGDWLGGGFYCGRLADQLGPEQPFYALPPSRVEGDRLATISEMAQRHRAAIREQSPHGPYCLGGYCIGALVAMEMARQWLAEGEPVAHLLLVDPPFWADRWVGKTWPLISKIGRGMGRDLAGRIALFDRYPVALSRWLRRPLASKMRKLLPAEMENPSSDHGDPEPDHAASDAVLDGLDYSAYFLAYRLHALAPLAVPTTLFIPESTLASRRARLPDASLIEPSLCRVEIVPGNHTTCVTRDIGALGARMRTALEST